MNKNYLKLSVVIALVNGLSIVEECLESLRQQSDLENLEVIVANRCNSRIGIFLRQKYPWIKLIEAPQHTTIPLLRALALREATGDLVGVLEDHCIVEPDWARSMIEAHQGEYPVIGGSVENAACRKLVDWAAFFCEYSQAMKPIPEGEVEAIPGNNVSYKRWIIDRFKHDINIGVWDFVLHEHIRNDHIPLYSIPSITVYHKMSRSLSWFIVQKFHFARSFAGARFKDYSWIRRALYGVGATILPPILAQRIVFRVWKKKRHHRELLLSFPMLILLLLSWGAGEAAGYIFGAGSSSAKVA